MYARNIRSGRDTNFGLPDAKPNTLSTELNRILSDAVVTLMQLNLDAAMHEGVVSRSMVVFKKDFVNL